MESSNQVTPINIDEINEAVSLMLFEFIRKLKLYLLNYNTVYQDRSIRIVMLLKC